MTVPLHVPSEVPKWVLAIGSKMTKEVGGTFLSVSEAAFYASTSIQLGPLANKPLRWIRDSSITYIHELQTLFNLANTGLILFYAHKVIVELQDRYHITAIDVVSAYAMGTIPICALACTTFAIGYIVLQRSGDLQTSNEPAIINGRHVGSFQESKGAQQKIAKVLNVSKIVLQLALACFAKNRFVFAFGILSSGYSLFKSCSFSWLRFSVQYYANRTLFNKIDLHYNMLLLHSKKQDRCSICLDNDQHINTAFCTNHIYHKQCLKNWIVSKRNQFLNYLHLQLYKTDHYQNGIHTHTTYKYNATIDANNLPCCPDCRDVPLQNTVDLEVTHPIHGKLPTSTTIKRPPQSSQETFETVYAAYNTVQAGLAFLQTYPELAEIIEKVQRVLLVTDCIGFSCSTYYLYDKVKEKLGCTEGRKHIAFNFAAATTLLASAALSYYIALQINTAMKPVFILQNLLKEIGFSPEVLKNTTIDWTVPSLQVFMQTLYVNRIMTTVALSFFSQQRMTNLWSAVAQSCSLFGISQLRWITFEQNLTKPLEAILASGGSAKIPSNAIESMRAVATYVVHPFCTKNGEHLKSTIRSIANHSFHLFDKSTWSRYWWVTTDKFGTEVSRALHYSVHLQKTLLESCQCTLIPRLADLHLTVIDSWYGFVAATHIA